MRIAKHIHHAVILAALLSFAGSARAAGDRERTAKLVAVLQSDAAFFEKARACQQLGEVGTVEAVPALAALLSDARLSAYARSGLENIHEPAAAAALRAALVRLNGDQLAGVVDSLGVLGDEAAAPELVRIANGEPSQAASASLRALGRIANRPAIDALRKALRSADPRQRDEAAAGCLQAAQRRLELGRRREAQELYDGVCDAKVSQALHVGATRGAMVARDKDRSAFLTRQLHSKELAIRQAVLLAVRETPSAGLSDTLVKSLAKADRDLRILILDALADCHDAATVVEVRQWVGSSDSGVRAAALRAMAVLAEPGDCGLLLDVTTGNDSEAAVQAMGILGLLPGPNVDPAILMRLEAARSSADRVRFIRLLGDRSAKGAIPSLMRFAVDADARVGQAAFGALAALGTPGDLEALIRLTLRSAAAVRDAAETSVVTAGARMENSAAAAALVKVFGEAPDAAARGSIVRMLASMGGAEAFALIKRALTDSDAAVRRTALQSLADWPDASPVETLLGLAEKEADASLRTVVLRGAIRMAAAGENPAAGESALGWLGRAKELVRSAEEKRLLLSGLAQMKRPGVLPVLLPFLQDAEVSTEAGFALVQIEPVVKGAADRATLRTALEQIEKSASNADLRQKAARLLQGMK